jgi:hypothetical protein
MTDSGRLGRLPPELIAMLDESKRVRGLRCRSEALRLVIAEAEPQPEPIGDVADRAEIKQILTARMRAGKVNAAIHLWKLLKEDESQGQHAGIGDGPVMRKQGDGRS